LKSALFSQIPGKAAAMRLIIPALNEENFEDGSDSVGPGFAVGTHDQRIRRFRMPLPRLRL
jgi:hypothetical protein